MIAGVMVGFPVDLRYGWDIQHPPHQRLLSQARKEFDTGFYWGSPSCAPWSIAGNKKDPAARRAEQEAEMPGLSWMQGEFLAQAKAHRGYGLESPWSSGIFREPSPMASNSTIPGRKMKQKVDQCQHGCKDEKGVHTQKSTGIDSNIRLNRTALRCRKGDNGIPHSVLQGQFNGTDRTASAAVCPMNMCKRIVLDVIGFLQSVQLLKTTSWPKWALHFNGSHLWTCERCVMGRGCPACIDNSMVPGECRHGTWPTEKDKRPDKPQLSDDPIEAFKRDCRNNSALEAVTLQMAETSPLNETERLVYLKGLFLKTVQESIAIFDQSMKDKKTGEHAYWISDPIMLAVYKHLLKPLLQVKGICVRLAPNHKTIPEPKLQSSQQHLRRHVFGQSGGGKAWEIDVINRRSRATESQSATRGAQGLRLAHYPLWQQHHRRARG